MASKATRLPPLRGQVPALVAHENHVHVRPDVEPLSIRRGPGGVIEIRGHGYPSEIAADFEALIDDANSAAGNRFTLSGAGTLAIGKG